LRPRNPLAPFVLFCDNALRFNQVNQASQARANPGETRSNKVKQT
jgi:hypothetical protein